MSTILLVIHLMIAVALVATILLQRSEGGALGIGGGGGGGLVSSRGAGNILSRTSAILAAMFFATSIGLTLLAQDDSRSRSILDVVSEEETAPLVNENAATGEPAIPAPAPLVPAPAERADEPMVPRAE